MITKTSERQRGAHIAPRQNVPASVVTQIPMPPDARALTTLRPNDYEDAFRIEGNPVPHRTGEQWARAVVEETPLKIRVKLVSGWTGLGLKLALPWSAHRVLGWEIRQSTPEYVLLGAGSRLGLSGELLFRREPNGVLFATVVHHHNRFARLVWERIEPLHREVVRSLLEHAARRAAQI